MQLELTQPLDLDPCQLVQLDLHSFLNVLNVLAGDLVYFHDTLGSQPFALTLEACYRVSESFQQNPAVGELLTQFARMREQFARDDKMLPPGLEPVLQQQLENLHSVVSVLDARSAEMQERLDSGDGWVNFDSLKLRNEIKAFLGVVEKNSLGRYHIVTNLAQKEPKDYMVHLDFDAQNGTEFCLPGVLKDVLRDLLANARKYTEPGGTIEVGLAELDDCIRLSVKDNGRGIPEDQLARVAEFGFRGRNVAAHETKGAGFGLTKAYSVSRRYQGRMWIDSAEGAGTAVTIEIPRQHG